MLLRLAVVALLGLAACSSSDAASNAEPAPPPDTSGWRMASGKEPTKAEFAALAATCEAKGGVVDNCLADLGLKRAQ